MARALYEEALALCRSLNDRLGVVTLLVNFGDAVFRLGDFDGSLALSEEGLTASRQLGDRVYEAFALGNLGQLALQAHDLDLARRHYEASRGLFAQLSRTWGVADALAGLAAVAGATGQPTRAARWLGAAQAACDGDNTPTIGHHGLFIRTVADARAALGDAAFTAAWDAGRRLSLDDAIAESTALAALDVTAGDLTAAPPPPVRVLTPPVGSLTVRELDVLRLLIQGQSDRGIAETLFISHATARTHMANILGKLGVSNRAAAVALAYEHGLI